jgi:hypothetical protein
MIRWHCSKCDDRGDGGTDALMAHYLAAHGGEPTGYAGNVSSIENSDRFRATFGLEGETEEVVVEHEDARWARVLRRWEAKHV